MVQRGMPNLNGGDLIETIARFSLRTGKEFHLTSGRVSNRYFEMKNTTLHPIAGRELAMALAQIVPSRVQFLVGIPVGGVPLAARVMDALLPSREVPTLVVRDSPKAHGTGRLIEGIRDENTLDGARVVVVEDVVTTGGSVLKVADKLREAGLVVEDVICAVLREPATIEVMARRGLKLSYLLEEREFVHAGE